MIENTVVQPGSVATVTRMSPRWIVAISDSSRHTRARPVTTPLLAPMPAQAAVGVELVVVERLPAPEVLRRLLARVLLVDAAAGPDPDRDLAGAERALVGGEHLLAPEEEDVVGVDQQALGDEATGDRLVEVA